MSQCIKNAGLTLIELLIILVVSSWFVEELFTVYLHTKEHHMNQNALQEITEEMRFSNAFFEKIIFGSGYLGLSNWNQISVYNSDLSAIIILKNNDEKLPENVRKKMKLNTEAIGLKQMDFNITSITKKINAGSSIFNIEKNAMLKWKKEDYLLIADYEHAEIIQILDMNNSLISLKEPLHYEYEKGAYVGLYLDKIYFIDNENGLYMHSEDGMTEEITALISDMHFDWIKNKSLKISLTFTLPYLINGKTFSRDEIFVVTNRE